MNDAVYFHIDPSRSAEVAKTLFGAVIGIVFLVCDRLSTYKKMARELDGKVVLCWCWAHQRRDFIHCAAGQVRMTQWCQAWIERIAAKRAQPKKDIWLRPLKKDWKRTLNR